MGYDVETKDGHRVYWPERRVVSVERSVKFNIDEEVVVGTLPLEGENTTPNKEIKEVERLTTIEAEKRDVNIGTPDTEVLKSLKTKDEANAYGRKPNM